MRNDEWLDKIAKEVQNLESPVNQNLWSGIQSQIATPGAVGGTSSSIWSTKLVASVISTVAVGSIATALLLNPTYKKVTEKAVAKEMVNAGPDKEHEKVVAIDEQVSAIHDLNISPEEKSALKETVDAPEQSSTQEVVAESPNKVVSNVPFSSSSVSEKKEQTEVIKSQENVAKISMNDEVSKPVLILKKELEKKEIPVTKNEPSIPVEEEIVKAKEQEVVIDLVNVFTPNGDGANDWFVVETKGLKEVVIVVMDSRNKVVWRGTSNDDRWDGRDQSGSFVPQGNYLYYVTGKDSEGELISKYQRLDVRY